MNAFAKPEEAMPYTFVEFPKAETVISEYSDLVGVQEYRLKSFNPNETVSYSNEEPVVHPAVLQDFRETFEASTAASQA